MGGGSSAAMWALCFLLTLKGILATVDNMPSFGLFVPPDLYYPSEEKFCLHTQGNAKDNSLLTVNLKTSSATKTLHVVTPESPVWSCVSFEVPKPSNDKEEVTMELQGSKADGSTVLLATRKLILRPKSRATIIHTDKAVYKPGQKVNFRIINIDQDMQVNNDKLPLVGLKDPQGNHLAQWNDVVPKVGIAELSYQTSEEPVLGKYTIKAGDAMTNFEVSQYVLPKFEVVPEAPESMSVQDSHFTVLIHARYTYGEKVSGKMTLKVLQKKRPQYWGWQRSPAEAEVQKDLSHEEVATTDGSGKLTFVINTNHFNMRSTDYQRELTLLISFTEEGTGVAMDATKTIKLASQLTRLSFKGSKDFYQPGAPYRGMLSLKTHDGQPVVSKTVYLKVKFQGKESTQNFTTDRNGEVSFKLSTEKWGNNLVSLEATTDDKDESYQPGLVSARYGRAYIYLSDIHADTKRSVYIRPLKSSASCDQHVTVTVDYVLEAEDVGTVEFFYLVLVEGRISHEGQKKVEGITPEGLSGSFEISLPVREISPSGKMLCFIVPKTGEVAVDTTTLQVTPCLKHAVSMAFSEDNVLPGSNVNMLLKANADSLCALRVVDKSVVMMRPEKELTEDKLQNLVKVQRTHIYDQLDRSYCNIEKEQLPTDISDSWWPSRMPYYYPEKKKDFLNIIQNMGLHLLSSWKVVAPITCRKNSIVPLMGRPLMSMVSSVIGPSANQVFPAAAKGGAVAEVFSSPTAESDDDETEGSGDPPRIIFPETWLWNLQPIPSSGLAEVPVTVPDTITEWTGQMLCVGPSSTGSVSSRSHSLGLSSPSSLTVFQPFFIDLHLPYSVKRGEEMDLKATASNYQSQPMMIRSSLHAPEQMLESKSSVSVFCLPGGRRKTISWKVTPKVLDGINITVSAEAMRSQGECEGQDTVVPKKGGRDAMVKTLLVEPEGALVEQSHSSMLNVEGNSISEKVKLELPKSWVNGSERAFLSFTGDIMGSASHNLGNLLKMSHGCGEQNMAGFAPNVYVLHYMKSSGQLTPELLEKAKKLMESGRDRQMNYKHPDGSFSAFGTQDKEGSTWLTAFSLKTLSQAKPYIHIDEEQQQKGVNWLKSKQKSDGCFQSSGRLLNNALKGGVDDEISLTAYIATALLEMEMPPDDPVVEKGLDCIQREPLEDASTYKLSLMSYAYSMANRTDQHAKVQEVLHKRAIRKEGLLNWSQDVKAETNSYWSRATSVDVELTGYALLGMTSGGSPSKQAMGDGAAVIRWMSKEKNPNGGFKSTQDTVVGLQAMARFAAKFFSKSGEVNVEVTSNHGFRQLVKINEGNRLLLQRVGLPRVPGEYTVTLSGHGTAFMQVTQRYNVLPTLEEAAFGLEVVSQCVTSNLLKISAQIWYKGTRPNTNMVLVEWAMLSGYTPQAASVEEVKKVSGVNRVETKDNLVTIYLEKVSSERQTLEILAERSVVVTGLKPAILKVFDYYKPDEQNTISYLSECK